MFHEVDASLQTFLAGCLPPDTPIGFDTPSSTDDRPQTPHVSLFLYNVAEDLSGRAAGWDEIRDDDHQVVRRHLPLRRYELSYFITAAAPCVRDEHQLLGSVLSALVNYEALPVSCLSPYLAAAGRPVALRTASLEPAAPGWKLWSALHMSPRSCLDLVVTAPLLPDRPLRLESPPEILELGVVPSSRPPDAQLRAEPGPPARRWTTVRIKERASLQSPDGSARERADATDKDPDATAPQADKKKE
ncbi:DUF4255 domain-containing protein [Streptomyces sp. NPDC005529]|uniref:DUF4255 domain-containing protein n=1 Tax=unclassified Streptomyces TaxID=2593676 RepID=UPI0033ADE380